MLHLKPGRSLTAALLASALALSAVPSVAQTVLPRAIASTAAELPPGFRSSVVRAGAVDLHMVRGGAVGRGPAVVLLHGWPQDWSAWEPIMPQLASAGLDVIAIDLRGIGGSSKPAGGYDKVTLAEDVRALLDALNLQRAHVVGHDIGGMVAYALAARHPSRVATTTIMDAPLPGAPISEMIERDPRAWHYPFHQAPGLAEMLVRGREAEYFGYFMRQLVVNRPALGEAAVARAAAAYRDPASLKAGFEFYRAFAKDKKDNAELFKRKLTMPVLALSPGGLMPQPYILTMMQPLAELVEGQAVPGTGHWMSEEQPEAVVGILVDFLRRHDARSE